jgi:hypothetical protein
MMWPDFRVYTTAILMWASSRVEAMALDLIKACITINL